MSILDAPRKAALGVALGGAAAIALAYLVLDRPFATFSHAMLHRPEWCIWLTWIANVPVPISVLGLTLSAGAWLCGWRPGARGQVFLSVCVASLLAEAMVEALKLAFGRPWPETWVEHTPSWIGTQTFGFFPFHGGRGYASFPSGHTTVISAPCAALWPALGRWRWALAALPALVMVGLLGCDYHFVSDCLAGALLGSACGVFARNKEVLLF